MAEGTNAQGALWMFFAVIFFSSTAVFIKLASSSLHTFEIVFFRCLFGLIVVIPLIIKNGPEIYKLRRPALHLLRILCAIVGMSGGFYAIGKLELATATALTFTRPLFMVVLAIIFLNELVRWRRGLATFIGFLGVLIIVQPGGMSFEPAVIIGLIAALAVGCALISVKLIVPYDKPESIMFSFTIGTVIVSIFPAVLVWQTPSNLELLLLVCIGILASLGQYCTIKAFEIGEATFISPIDYFQLIFATLGGFYIFNETPQISTFLGSAVIVLSTFYIIIRESKNNDRPSPPSGPMLSG